MFTAQFTLTRRCKASVNSTLWAQARQSGAGCLGGPSHPLSGTGSSAEGEGGTTVDSYRVTRHPLPTCVSDVT